jgi:hypothetical protein
LGFLYIIQIDRLNIYTTTDTDYTILFDSLCNVENWTKFFVGNHKISNYDIDYSNNYGDSNKIRLYKNSHYLTHLDILVNKITFLLTCVGVLKEVSLLCLIGLKPV